MSREKWFRQISQQQGPLSSNEDLLRAFRHERLEGRTTDPDALQLDEACEIFLEGVRLARRGDIDAGRSNIATAYLLDGRSINFVHTAPNTAQLRDMCVDVMLLSQLTQANVADLNKVTFGAHVLRLLMAGRLSTDPREGQNLLSVALKSATHLIDCVEKEPHLGTPFSQGGTVLGGCMTLPVLRFERCSIHMAMGNHKKGVSDLSLALKVDSKFARARDARASLWASLRLQDDKTVFREYKKLVEQVHPDNRGLEAAYGWMAYCSLSNAELGTLDDAKGYFEKCLRASARNLQLYGDKHREPPIVKRAKEQFAMAMNHPTTLQFRENIDAAYANGRLDDISVPIGFQAEPISPINSMEMAHSCLHCGVIAIDKGKPLSRCTQCKKAWYCSRECQTKDWKRHKGFCKANKPVTCASCGKAAADATNRKLEQCAQCKSVSYCSRQCQKADWKKHKTFCREVKAAMSNTA